MNSRQLPHDICPIFRSLEWINRQRKFESYLTVPLNVMIFPSNDMIHVGPKLQQDLFNVLVRFRLNPVGVACDIKEMYLQIEIKEQNRCHFRLFWRDLDPNREPDVFEFSRVIFGKNSAPVESQFVAQENARRNQDRYPLATETVLKSTYMDDSIDSVENDDEGVELYCQLKAL